MAEDDKNVAGMPGDAGHQLQRAACCDASSAGTCSAFITSRMHKTRAQCFCWAARGGAAAQSRRRCRRPGCGGCPLQASDSQRQATTATCICALAAGRAGGGRLRAAAGPGAGRRARRRRRRAPVWLHGRIRAGGGGGGRVRGGGGAQRRPAAAGAGRGGLQGRLRARQHLARRRRRPGAVRTIQDDHAACIGLGPGLQLLVLREAGYSSGCLHVPAPGAALMATWRAVAVLGHEQGN